jgi:hypothetical protein
MVRWRPISYGQVNARNQFSGGVNAGNTTLDLKDNESYDESGVDTFNYPSVSLRKGRTSHGTSGGGVTYLLTNLSNTHLLRAVGTQLQYNSSGTSWSNIAGTWNAGDWDAANFDVSGPVVIITNGTDTPRIWNGSSLSVMTGTPPKGNYITSDPSRVWMAKGDVIYYCAFQNPNDWTSAENAGSVEYFTFGGGNITALHNYNNLKCVWKQNSFAVIYGVSYYDFRLVEVSNAIGCVSFKTVQEVAGRLFWLGSADIYAFTQGAPTPIGQKVRRYLDSINTTYWSKCFAGTDGQRYYLGIVTGTNTEPDTMLVFDTRYNVWRVYDIAIPQLRYSAFINNQWYCGNASGQTYKMNDNVYTDDGTAISWFVTSKPFDEGVKEAEKEYYEMHLQSYLPTGSTMTVSVSTDDRSASFTSIDTVTASSVEQNKNVIVPMDTVPLTNWLRYKISGTGYFELNEVQRYARVQPVQI